MKTPALLIILLAAAGCGDIQQLCFIQRPGLGGYGIVFTSTGPATGTCPDPTVLPDTFGDIYSIDKFGETQDQVVVRPQSLFPTNATGTKIVFPPNDTAHPFEASGNFTSLSPDANNTCVVPTLSQVRQDQIATGGPTLIHAVDMSNLTFLTGALYQGSQLEVDATYTIGACSRPYHGIGITPLVDCDPADPNACVAVGNAAEGIVASGINPSYPVSCNADVGAMFPQRAVLTSPNIVDDGDPVCFFTGSTFPQLK